MASVVDTKLYDILGVPPGASENELKKVPGRRAAGGGAGLRGGGGEARPRSGAAREPAPGPGRGATRRDRPAARPGPA